MQRHDRYKCLTCKENYASKVHAYKHYKRGHLVQGLEPQLHCPHCPAAFHRNLLLQMHIRKHKGLFHIINYYNYCSIRNILQKTRPP